MHYENSCHNYVTKMALVQFEESLLMKNALQNTTAHNSLCCYVINKLKSHNKLPTLLHNSSKLCIN